MLSMSARLAVPSSHCEPLRCNGVAIALVTTAQPSVIPAQPSVIPAQAGIHPDSPRESLSSGIITKNIDNQVRPQDDFYQYINGKWLSNAIIPADKASWGSFQELAETTNNHLNSIIQGLLTKNNSLEANSEAQQIVSLYTSFMDESSLNSLGISPLQPLFTKVDDIKSKQQLAGLIADFSKLGVTTPFDIAIHQDAKNSSVMVADLVQSGLGLPDRDYYLLNQDKNLAKIKQLYTKYVSTMLQLSGDKNASSNAVTIVDLETRLAQLHWSNVQNRDPIKTYNKIAITKLASLMPNFDWSSYLSVIQLQDRVDYVIVSQPSFFNGLDKLFLSEPLATWQLYFKWKILNSYAGYLSKEYSQNSFAFYGTVLSGTPKQLPRYKRAISLVNGSLGFALGKLYVAQYFPVASKKQMQILVDNVIKQYAISINELDWMGDKTKKEAMQKLRQMSLKIAYPQKWRDYASLQIKSNDLIGNLIRINQFEYERSINKLGKPVDKDEWMMTPQTVNAYYNPELNEIVFPAAILQPPFFSPNVDSAANYGGIGAVIGHEISHAFDDQGSQYDAKGNLRNWWTPVDRIKFSQKTQQLVKQYSSYSPLAGYYINGQLTLGENIADNSGLAIAYKAYHLSLNNQPSPVIDGLIGEQRFYAAWAQVWRGKVRDKQALMSLKTDPHSPTKFRANGTLSNQDGFYQAYKVTPTDKMYLAPDKRVHIW